MYVVDSFGLAAAVQGVAGSGCTPVRVVQAASPRNSFVCSASNFLFRIRLPSSQVSWVSAHSARISLRHDWVLGKMRATSVHRSILFSQFYFLATMP